MHFIITCLDKPGALATRLATMDAHKAYIATRPIKVLLSGPLVADDGEQIIGSFFLVEAADRAAVEAFQANDPLYKAGIWSTTDVRAFIKRVDNRD